MTKNQIARSLKARKPSTLPPPLPYTSKVALRMPEIMKEAAQALSSCLLHEANSDETVNARAPTSMNNMLVELLWKGLITYLPIVEAEIKRQAKQFEPYRDIASFLMKSPSVGGVQPEDFPEGSAARKLLMGLKQEYPDLRWPMSRAEALDEFAMNDRTISQLFATRELLTNVIEANPRPSW